MTATTVRHALKLKAGRLFAVDVTETPSTVYLHFSGDKPFRSEEPRVRAFLWPIVNRYEDDDRLLELDGVHNKGGAMRLYTLGRAAETMLLGLAAMPRPRANA